jgi:hypothetical protein
MAALTGRTVSRWVNFSVEDAAAMRDIPINTLSVCGITYEEQELTAFQDAVKGALPGMPDAPIEVSGPWDTTAVVTAAATTEAPALSGSHTVLSVINGGSDPKALDIKIGIRTHWEDGAPQFGITATATSGYLCVNYTVDLSTMTYTAKFVLYPGSAIPAWGTTIEAVL